MPSGELGELGQRERTRLVAEAKRVVVKLGTAVLTGADGRVALGRFYSFVESVAALRRTGREVLLVSSGAIGLGAARLGAARAGTLSLKQACAAVGQGRLMALYADAFDRLGIPAAQILITEGDLSNRVRYLNLRSTLAKLLSFGAVPIINENDTISTAELTPVGDAGLRQVNFGDNDRLSALVAAKIEADALVLLTDVDGLYTADPRAAADAAVVPVVADVTSSLEASAAGPRIGRGGMRTKLEAARIATHSGCTTVIASGFAPGVIDRLFAGDEVGTVFLPRPGLSGKRRWIAFATTVQAAVVVNQGARRALVERKASLLPVGVLEVRGEFERGDVVSILDETGDEFARGIVNYSSGQAAQIAGLRSDRVEELVGSDEELVTRDNIALLEELHAA